MSLDVARDKDKYIGNMGYGSTVIYNSIEHIGGQIVGIHVGGQSCNALWPYSSQTFVVIRGTFNI